ncbi:MAG: low-specificity L-threonine aldolase [Deltaproteobacteria bacterium]|nr:low-specificity L-threonine aldolase [Deltaproteobacteria bacterium]
MKPIDFRSDTVTRPGQKMRQAMSRAEVGDDVYGDDPSVNELERMGAELLGYEKALFTSSGTQANLIGIMSHCGRGDEYIVGQQAHTYKYEGGGAAVLGSIQPQPVEFEKDATLDLRKVADKIKPDDIHFARTRLLCLENSHNGKPLPLDYLQKAGDFAKVSNLNLHLDGARLFNAAVAQDVEVSELSRPFDSTSICLSKGLGAPVGSLLCGSAEFIAEARKWRKMVGGGMRQAGIIAAASIYALQNNVARLAEDHENARDLADGLNNLEEISVEENRAQTNMVFFTMEEHRAKALAYFLAKKNILISAGATTRMVTHLDITDEDVRLVLKEIGHFLAQ